MYSRNALREATKGSNDLTSYAMAKYQNPSLSPLVSDFDAHSFPLGPLHISRSSQQLRPFPDLRDSATAPEVYKQGSSSPKYEAEDQKSTDHRRIADLEAELAELKRSRAGPTTAIAAPCEQEQMFRDLVTKYKNVKKLYFEVKGENLALTQKVEELLNSEKTPDGKDKIIEAWKAQYEKLSAQLRAQEDTDSLVSSWREKYDMLLVLHSSSQEEAARSAEQAKVENESLALELQKVKEAMEIQAEELSRVKWGLSNAQRKLEAQDKASASYSLALHDQKMHFEQTLEIHQRNLQVERQEKERALRIVQRLGSLLNEAHKIMSEGEKTGAVG